MSNLYRLDAGIVDLARQFGAEPAPELPVPSPVQPGKQGLIVRGTSRRRSMHVLQWGFPRPGRNVEPSPVNLVADLTNPMWDGMAPEPRYRCLIPVSALGQPDGPKGWMTRTWFSIPEWPVFALAGFCRSVPEWGAVYAAMTGESNALVKPLNDRSPIILAPDEYDLWLTASIRDVIGFQFRPPFPADRMAMARTDELWVPLSERSNRPRRKQEG
ncbi:SOS response-associated peptidase family protein [Reyranella sp.]|uniref:SOS response-associated peptidase family protein n=1 Tax=Reyranella sp. TaxID=1929291 RepID=UPI003D11DCC7